MKELTTAQYDGTRGIQDHILNMADKAAKLKTLGMNVDESFLVQFILFPLSLAHSRFTTTPGRIEIKAGKFT